MHETDATISVSRRVSSDCVAECRKRSISSLIDAVLLDVGVGVRDVRLGLIVIEVRDEILDRVLREEIAEFGAELGRERLVVAQDQRRLLDELDDPRHRDRLAAARDAEQRLRTVAAEDALGERRRRGGLVAGQRVGRNQTETVGHGQVL
jgi:hypothetical protein